MCLLANMVKPVEQKSGQKRTQAFNAPAIARAADPVDCQTAVAFSTFGSCLRKRHKLTPNSERATAL